ncbi:binding-protein-dependent transport system inner membrane protein [Salinisphaera sp. T31B1]
MYLLMAPAVCVVLLLLIVPTSWLFWQSIYAGGFTLANYERIFTDSIYFDTFVLTFRISAIVTLGTLVLGYPLAYAACVLPRRWALPILVAVVLPFWTSVLVRTYAWLILLGHNGVINSFLMSLGAVDAPLRLVNNEFGTIVATIHILLPFMVLPLYSAMQKIPDDLMLAGMSLGGSPFHAFRRIYFPLSLTGVMAGAALVFVLCLGFYITPELMGGGKTVMASMVVSRNVELFNDWGAASAVSVVLLVIVLIVFYLASRIVPVDRIVGAG